MRTGGSLLMLKAVYNHKTQYNIQYSHRGKGTGRATSPPTFESGAGVSPSTFSCFSSVIAVWLHAG